MALIIAAPIEAVITAFDQPGPLNEGALRTALNQARRELAKTTDEIQYGAFAEVAAWHFSRADTGSGEPRRLYLIPVGSGVTAENTPFYLPGISNVCDESLTHWIERANNLQHLLMVARSIDLVWEIGKYLRQSPDKRPFSWVLSRAKSILRSIDRTRVTLRVTSKTASANFRLTRAWPIPDGSPLGTNRSFRTSHTIS